MFTNTCYVLTGGNNATAQVGNPLKPYSTMSAALAAVSPSLPITLKIGLGTFNTPPYQETSRNNITIIGSGRSFFNSTVTQSSNSAYTITDPTKLLGGTILKGQLAFLDVTTGIKVYNLGIDCGSDYVTAGGTESNGFGIVKSISNATNEAGTTNLTPYTLCTNVEVKNIAILCKNPGSLFHGAVIEDCYDYIIEDVLTCNGVHGMALKGTLGKIRNITCLNHGQNGMILKANTYSMLSKNIVDGLHISNCVNGLAIQNKGMVQLVDPAMISNVFIQGGTTGVTAYNDYGHGIKGLAMTNVKVRGQSGAAFTMTGCTNMRVLGCFNNDTLYEV